MRQKGIIKSNLPLVKEISRAIDAFSCFATFKDEPYGFLLDSASGEQKLGRYSFIGADPFLVFKSKGDQVTIASVGQTKKLKANPFNELKKLLTGYALENRFDWLPFIGGAVGYFGYDLCHFVEKLPYCATDDLGVADCCLGFYDSGVVLDHILGKIYLISTGLPEKESLKAEARAEVRLRELEEKLSRQFFRRGRRAASGRKANLCSNFTRSRYQKAIDAARQYIIAGDIFQVNLSQRFETDLKIPTFELYQRLRSINPAPFASYLNFGDTIIVSSSPERFLRLKDGVVQTRPIKGTRPRGQGRRQDELLAEELLRSEKDKAEHIMIVDLERNDLGRVCEYGSVKVSEPMILESYPTVHHLVSTVEGRLAQGKDAIDLLRACFPGGSITGAPKVRAMEIIDELEPTKRNIYTGSIGYVSFDGQMNLNIVIRTFLATGGKVCFQVGGGVVFDSKPEEEYVETLDKAKALIQVLEL